MCVRPCIYTYIHLCVCVCVCVVYVHVCECLCVNNDIIIMQNDLYYSVCICFINLSIQI